MLRDLVPSRRFFAFSQATELAGNREDVQRHHSQHRDHEDSVGVNVSITHMAPTLLGMEAEITVTVSVYEKRRVVFDITAKDALDTICKGTHERFIVDVNQTRERLKAKAAKAKALEG